MFDVMFYEILYLGSYKLLTASIIFGFTQASAE